MNRHLFLALVLFSIVSSCKKGENDPFLSLRSRKARLCGEWKVIYEEEQKYTYEDGNNPLFFSYELTQNNFFDGSTKSGTNIQTGTYNIYDGQNYALAHYSGIPVEVVPQYYLEYFNFNKDGTFSFCKTWTNTSQKIEYQGTWEFLHKNSDRKNKEYITTTLDANTYVYTDVNGETAGYPYPFSNGYPDPYTSEKITEYQLIELRTKEFEMRSSYKHQWHYGMNGGEKHIKYTSTRRLIPK